jgi:hypothetical protein
MSTPSFLPIMIHLANKPVTQLAKQPEFQIDIDIDIDIGIDIDIR